LPPSSIGSLPATLSRTPSPELPDPNLPVGNDVLLYRLVSTHWCDVVDGQWEFQSGAFDNTTPQSPDESPDDMSVVLGDTLQLLGRDPTNLPDDTPWTDDDWGVAVLRAGYVTNDEKQQVRRTPEELEPAHGDVRGKKGSKRRKRLKAHAQWVIRPAAEPRDDAYG
jgi:hypothetical protein